MLRYRLAIILATMLLSLPLAGTAAEGKVRPCDSEQHRQFDFWLGDWDVFNPAGDRIGENLVTLEQGSCVLHEHWRDVRGGTGESFNIYDVRRGVWHQTWVAATGNLLLLEGGLQDGAMVLSGEQPTGPGKPVILNRITWTPLPDGSVEQRWDQSLDKGASWKSGFVGIYRRKPEAGQGSDSP